MADPVWAPYVERLELLLLPLDGAAREARHPLRRGDDGIWVVDVDAAPEATYSFSLDGGPPRPDPRGRRLPEGPHGPSQLFDVGAFAWTDTAWTGVDLAGAVIYELHVGTFTEQGTLDAACDRLDHLVALGVTLVELMPLAPFPGRHGWGYDGVAPFAVHEPYGGPAALQRFVDAAHARGLGVCLDVVYNHLGPDGNMLAEFAPYFSSRHSTPWGDALNLDGPDSDPVRRWVLDNVRQWLVDFHVDALRLDAVHELHDDRAVHLLEEMSRSVDALAEETGRWLWLIAESDRNDPRTVTARGRGAGVVGQGLHAQWADDVHHALHVALTGETQGYYADFAAPEALAKVMGSPFFHDGTWSSFRGRTHGRPVDVSAVPPWRFVASLQTHDQVGNRATGDRPSATLSPGLLACGAAILLTAPWTPMLFMGEEWGAATPWQYFTDHTDPELGEAVSRGRQTEFASHGWDAGDVPDPQDPATFERSRLDWSEVEREPHSRLLAWYLDLIALRRSAPELYDAPPPDPSEVAWNARDRTFTMQRGSYLLLANLSDAPRTLGASGSVVLSWTPGVKVDADRVVLPAESAAILRRHTPEGSAVSDSRVRAGGGGDRQAQSGSR